MNRYPLWKYLLLAVVIVVGLLYAAPNLFGNQPAVQISRASGDPVPQSLVPRVREVLSQNDIEPVSVGYSKGRILARYKTNDQQLKAASQLKQTLGDKNTIALNLAPRTPEWLRSINAQPMALGLDLRGGVHFLLNVDTQALFKKRYQQHTRDLAAHLREQSIRYKRAHRVDDGVRISFGSDQALAKARDSLSAKYSALEFKRANDARHTLVASYTSKQRKSIVDSALTTNLNTLRNRVNELGVSEPLVQRQGRSHIVVELPGVQNTARAKRLLGKTATLEYHLVDQQHSPQKAKRTGDVPEGSALYQTKDGSPILLQKDVIASGDQLTGASAGFDKKSGSPDVQVTLNSQAADKMFNVTSAHVGDPMAVLYTQTKLDTVYKDGKRVTNRTTEQKVISVANIRSAFGKRFQTTGLSRGQAHDLALLLRAGALAAPVHIVQQRTVGPSLGADNIAKGRIAVIIGFLLVVVFMACYYKLFGLIADCALFMNLVLIVAALSILQATLTLPGIAGIVLTVGMAVDANVLIFERIREELSAGNGPQSAIKIGYDRALSSIADANVTTLIAALMLFGFGTGPVQGFAITLSIGIVTSMFTAIIGTRAIVNLVYGRRQRLTSLSI
ncbi:protein translocase subunit SecD [Salinisphaera sp. USBA-960]|uniref:protein translocase subunit SecD n=1 Tax=Salinisphaera orenii TaxID=856731 RepID=UPI000DBE1CFD|nr:protein translocase subunit SecD [Salifodinibacter halophilus]NNC25763.1 protein translocase subunit SecD [Salifodinibacter halophilus]